MRVKLHLVDGSIIVTVVETILLDSDDHTLNFYEMGDEFPTYQISDISKTYGEIILNDVLSRGYANFRNLVARYYEKEMD